MDNTILKKRLSTYMNERGALRNVSDEVLFDVLRAWEAWPGKTKDFYTSIGVSWKQMAKLMGKAKKMQREGHFPESEFKEVKVLGGEAVLTGRPCTGIELQWDGGKVIRFPCVEPLIDFLKKVA